MIDRRAFISALAGGLIAGPFVVDGQQAGAAHRIGVLEVLEAGSNVANLNAFDKGSENSDTSERFPDLAIELVQLKPEVIVTTGDSAVLAARRATLTTPIVMASSLDPVGAGVVASLARPAGNVTEFHFWAPPKLGGQRLQILKELVPSLSRVAVLWNSGNVYSHLVLKETEVVASASGVQLQRLDVVGSRAGVRSRHGGSGRCADPGG